MIRSRGLIVVAVLVVVAGVSGCSALRTPGAADERRPGTPVGVDLEPYSEGPFVVAYDDGSVDVVTMGSSSCPAEATSAEQEDLEFVVAFKVEAEGPCTADSAPTTHTFTAASIGSTVPTTARLLFQGSDELVVEVIRAEDRKGVSP
ncbi:hypothetical protein ACI2IP_15700 [Microbacterium sp. NPDC090218]